ncbi:MAG: nucleoside hydrolase [Victivallales bacterium]|jgi:purine nucleosidase|nr:nucleoside hydrolase [Victivallales bacterium]
MPEFRRLPDELLLERLTPPTGKVRAVLDTDTYNEVDDQFALAYALLSPEACDLEAIYAAPFHNNRSDGPLQGMERSYDEILRVMERMKRPSDGLVFKGSTSYLPAPGEPVDSPAARDLIAKARSSEEPLFVMTIGAPTNVASAILMDPEIIERIIVVWLGGQPHTWPTAREFNLQQDVPASQVLFDSGVPFVQIPCTNVAEHLRTTVPELEAWLRGKGDLGDYLCDIVASYSDNHFAWSKVIWDISAVAYLINASWVPSTLVHAPILTERITYSADWNRPLMRVATHCGRDAIFRDLFTKFANV